MTAEGILNIVNYRVYSVYRIEGGKKIKFVPSQLLIGPKKYYNVTSYNMTSKIKTNSYEHFTENFIKHSIEHSIMHFIKHFFKVSYPTFY